MLRRSIQHCFLFFLVISSFMTAAFDASTTQAFAQRQLPQDMPTVDPNYIYDQLFHMVTSFQHREAGYDDNLPVSVNGHDEFAAYWSQEMARNLEGLGPQLRRDEFPIKGWTNRPAQVPAFNVEVSIPGVTHPEQVIVIGCHYDGEAISTQSAYDDASGCAIELGVARAMGQFWRSHHVYPARTLRFVLFDAEEQGLYGSFHYLNSTINGDVKNIVAMFNEEQNGIAYPIRYLGQIQNALMPFYIEISPLQNSRLYPHQDKLSQQQKDNITQFRSLMQEALSAVFTQFQALGYQMLSYHSENHRDVFQPIFVPEQLGNIKLEEDVYDVGSDQIPFTLAGLPCATFLGDPNYYAPHPPPGSYPYDQPQDTIQLMNTFADGSSQQSYALTMALALPGMLTTWMLNQPSIVGNAQADNNPIAAMSDIGQTKVGQSISLDARTSFDPTSNSSALNYSWNFGDGTTASGIAVQHSYDKAGNYTVSISVSSASGERSISKLINVVKTPTSYANFYTQFHPTGSPRHNPAVILPVADDSLSDKVTTVANAQLLNSTRATTIAAQGLPVTSIVLIVGACILLVLIATGILLGIRRRKMPV